MSMNWFLLWLVLHITAAVIAFGPLFVFPIVGTLLAASPQHASFALHLNKRISRRLVVPFGASMLVSGSGLIWTANINWFGTPFLIVAVLLYLGALTLGLAVLTPNTERLIRIVDQAPAGGPLTATAPPPQVPRLIRQNQIAGGATMILFLTIIILMIVQPGGLSLR